MKNRELTIGIIVTVLVGAGAFALGSLLGPAQDRAVEIAPANSFFYVNAFLSPSTSQKRAIRDLLEKFPDGGTPEEAEEALDRFLDDLFAAEGFTWTEDMKPWIGDQLALFFTPPPGPMASPDGGVLIASEDEDAALEWVEKAKASADVQGPTEERTYEGVDYSVAGDQATYGFVEGFLVIGTEGGFKKVVDASKGESLADSERYAAALDPLTDDHLALFYFDAKPLFESFGAALPPGFAQNNPLMQASSSAAAAVLYARDDAIVTDVAGGIPGGPLGDLAAAPNAGLLPQMPGDSWGALGASDIGRSFQALFDSLDSFGMPGMATGFISGQVKRETGLDLEKDVFPWMGDMGLFVRGTSVRDVGGGVVIETKDQKAAGAALLRLRAYMERQGAPIQPDSLDAALGFAIQDRAMPEPVNFVVSNNRFLIVYGRQATASALSTPSPLSDDPGYKAAVASLQDDFVPGGYFDIQSIVTLIEAAAADAGATESPDFQKYQDDVKPNLEPLTHIVFGSKTEGDRSVQRIVVGVE